MCQIIVKPPFSVLSDKELKDATTINKDGVGYMFWNEANLVIKKYKSFKRFLKGYNSDIVDYPKSYFVIHFRFGTHGEDTIVNVQPFSFVKNTAGFCHNGILSSFATGGKLSDTANFVKKVLRPAGLRAIEDKALLNAITSIAEESTSKFVMMIKEKVYIINEAAGEWRNGCWFSNKTIILTGKGWTYYDSLPDPRYPKVDLDLLDEKDWKRFTDKETHRECELCGNAVGKDEVRRMVEGLLICEDCQRIYSDAPNLPSSLANYGGYPDDCGG